MRNRIFCAEMGKTFTEVLSYRHVRKKVHDLKKIEISHLTKAASEIVSDQRNSSPAVNQMFKS